MDINADRTYDKALDCFYTHLIKILCEKGSFLMWWMIFLLMLNGIQFRMRWITIWKVTCLFNLLLHLMQQSFSWIIMLYWFLLHHFKYDWSIAQFEVCVIENPNVSWKINFISKKFSIIYVIPFMDNRDWFRWQTLFIMEYTGRYYTYIIEAKQMSDVSGSEYG